MGRFAQATGARIEALVDLSLRHYRARGRIAWSSTYPEVKFMGKGMARATGQALPDRCVCVRELGGRLLWLEIKSWQAKDRHTLTQRLHQFEMMREFSEAGAMGAYLVAWRWDGCEEWRIYPVMNLNRKQGTILFEREAGLPVGDPEGWPDWLPAMLEVDVAGYIAKYGWVLATSSPGRRG